MRGKPLVREAEDFAVRAHAGQKYGSRPYVRHLSDVHWNLGRFFVMDDDLLCAGWLHDCIEDAGEGEALRRLPRDFAPFLCRACGSSYCARHWKIEAEFDEGFYEGSRGTCPKGHRQAVD